MKSKNKKVEVPKPYSFPYKRSHLDSHSQWGKQYSSQLSLSLWPKGSITSKGGNRKTATVDFVNGVFLSPPHHQRELIMTINLLCYLSIYGQIYSDSLKKETPEKTLVRNAVCWSWSKLLALHCLVWQAEGLPGFSFHRVGGLGMAVKSHRFLSVCFKTPESGTQDY